MRAPGGLRALALLLAATTAPADAPAPLVVAGLAVADERAQEVIRHPSIIRRQEPARFPGNLQIYEFLLERPPLAATMARHLYPALEPYEVTEKGDNLYGIRDRDSIEGDIRLLAKAEDRRIYLADGRFRSLAQLLAFRGRTAILLEYREVPDAGRRAMESRPTLYVRIDHPLLHALVKIFGPIIGGIIDRRLEGLTAAAMLVTERIARDPAGLLREMREWRDVRPQDLEDYRRTLVEEGSEP